MGLYCIQIYTMDIKFILLDNTKDWIIQNGRGSTDRKKAGVEGKKFLGQRTKEPPHSFPAQVAD
ncbi:MAG: hypothetical protein IID17_01785 [Nitrospinae bacterium]|nr:hypothetical protein [Nitrospinota bacterium]